jgi:hypothetical protein
MCLRSFPGGKDAHKGDAAANGGGYPGVSADLEQAGKDTPDENVTRAAAALEGVRTVEEALPFIKDLYAMVRFFFGATEEDARQCSTGRGIRDS